ncbi:MAG: STAS domain-containing protein [Anaerolineae bacterium]|nr:STAS domain-containing protein [Anaerolineae bacterium]
MATYVGQRETPRRLPLHISLRAVTDFFLQPVHLFRSYELSNLRPDLIAGLTVAVILLPQAIAYALIAELPPQTGLYAAIVAAIVGALWGSSHHLQTGPTNALSLLLLSTLLTIVTPGTAEYVVLAGLIALVVGGIQLVMGLARLGVLVNFVSHSVIVGFSAGAGVLIAINQARHLLRLEFASHGLLETVHGLWTHLPETHLPTMLLAVGTLLVVLLLRRLNRKLPGPLIAMVVAAVVVGIARLHQGGVVVIGELPRSLPPLTDLSHLNMSRVGQLAPGALAIAAIGLVEAMSIARSIASHTNQRLDSNQEFLGQGLANIAVGILSGYPCSGSFTRSAVNSDAGAQTRLASVFSGIFVLLAMLAFAPLAAYVPRAALSAVLILTALSMINREEMTRIMRGARADAVIMVVTLLATLFLHLEFAVLAGILLSFAVYIIGTSVPRVFAVLPDDRYRHFIHQPEKSPCPQLAIFDILGDLYFGAVSHIEKAITQHLAAHPTQRILLLRMHSVQHCDFSGIHTLESIVRSVREKGGDLYMVRVREPVLQLMKTTGFWSDLGEDHFLDEDTAISHLFYRVLDPATCIYECDVRVFRECQNLPRQPYPSGIPRRTDIPVGSVVTIPPRELWQRLRSASPPYVVDVREEREFQQSHIPEAQSMPLSSLLQAAPDLPPDRPIVFVCRSGRRSERAAYLVRNQGAGTHHRYEDVAVLQGGMLAWEAANLLTAVEGFAA